MSVLMETLDFKEEPMREKGVLRSAILKHGEQFAMIFGTLLMPV